MTYCSYYQAEVEKPRTWLLVAVLRSFEHVSFDRTLDKELSIFEFFVPQDTEEIFLDLMEYLKKEGIIKNLKKLPNRLKN